MNLGKYVVEKDVKIKCCTEKFGPEKIWSEKICQKISRSQSKLKTIYGGWVVGRIENKA